MVYILFTRTIGIKVLIFFCDHVYVAVLALLVMLVLLTASFCDGHLSISFFFYNLASNYRLRFSQNTLGVRTKTTGCRSKPKQTWNEG